MDCFDQQKLKESIDSQIGNITLHINELDTKRMTYENN